MGYIALHVILKSIKRSLNLTRLNLLNIKLQSPTPSISNRKITKGFSVCITETTMAVGGEVDAVGALISHSVLVFGWLATVLTCSVACYRGLMMCFYMLHGASK
jgi:hypothetical protein